MRHKIYRAFCKFISNTKVQLTAAMISLLVLFALFGVRIVTHIYSDIYPEIKWVRPKIVGQQVGVPVKIGLSVISFPEFDLLKNRFVLDANIWFQFNPTKISIKTVEDFDIGKGNITKKIKTDERIIDKNNLYVSYRVRVEFTSDLNYNLFPLDSHKVFLVLDNNKITPDDLVYVSNKRNFILPKNIYTGDSKIIGKETYAGYYTLPINENEIVENIEHPRVIYVFNCIKMGFKKLIVIFLPLIILLFVALFSLAMTAKREALNLSIATITALLAYRFVIETMSPNVSYFTLMDYAFMFILGICFLVFLLNIQYVESKRQERIPETILFYLLQVLSVFIFYWFLFKVV